MAGLAEPPDEDVVAGLEEHDPRADATTLQRAAHGREPEDRVARADIEHDGDVGEALPVRGEEIREVRQQFAGQVVDDRVAEVLEELGRRRLAPAGQTR